MLLKLMFFLLNLLNLFTNLESYNYLTNKNLTYENDIIPESYLIKRFNWPYIGFSCSVTDNNYSYFISSTKIFTHYSSSCSMSKKVVQIIKFNSNNNSISDNLYIGSSSTEFPTAQGDAGSDDVTTCGINKNANMLYYIAQNLKKCPSSKNYDASIVRIDLNTFSYIDRTILRSIPNVPTFSINVNHDYDYLNWPSTSIFINNYELFIGFRGIYTGVLNLNISSSNIELIGSLQKTFQAISENNAYMTESTNYYTDRIRHITKSFIIKKTQQIYFVEDSGYTDCKIIKFNYTKPMTQNDTEIITLSGINYITDIEIDPILERIYIVSGLLSSELYQYSYSFTKIKFNEQCNIDFLKFDENWGVIWNIELDYQTGYIYAIISERYPHYGIVRIRQKDLSMDLDEKVNFRFIVTFNQINYFGYIPNMNISSLHLDKGKLILFPNINTYSSHNFIVINLSGCSPGRGKNTNICEICDYGKYAENIGSNQCFLCDKGRANNIIESVSCNDCTQGKYASLIGQITCDECNTGFYSNEIGTIKCKNCSSGKYSMIVGSTSSSDCEFCESGKISSQGSTDCNICELGKYSNNGKECVNCPKGKFSSVYNINSQLDCALCSIGKYTDEIGLISETQCKNCPLGTVGLYEGAISNSTCFICPAGKYRGALDNQCIDCPDGYISSKKSSSCYQCQIGRITLNKIVCIDCSPGKYSGILDTECISCASGFVSQSQSSVCIQCELGKFSNNHITCINCPKGKYSDVFNIDNINSCKDCLVGKYNSELGSKTKDDCKNCPNGKYGIVKGAISIESCIGCSSGKYAISDSCQTCDEGFISSDNSITCTICDLGKYSDFGIECISCPPGKYNDVLGIYGESKCKLCPIGKYNIHNSSTSIIDCINCDLGSYSTISGQTNKKDACISCPAGRYRDANINPQDGCTICPNGKISSLASSICNNCERGKYVYGIKDTDHITCKSCSPGKYNQMTGGDNENSCMLCPKGKYNSNSGSNSSDDCLVCLPGLYNDKFGSSNIIECKSCPAGKYRHLEGGSDISDCYDCIPGTYSELKSVSCKVCEVGKYSSSASSTECETCSESTYSDTNGTINCKSCIIDSVQSSDATFCECSENTYYFNDECIECPANFICPKGSFIDTISVKAGYWRYNSNTTITEECRSEYACKGGIIVNSSDDLCREGHVGPLCDVCINGWAKNDGACFECKKANMGRSIALTIIIPLICIFVLIFLIKTANPSDNKKEEVSGVAKILMNYAQVFSMASTFDINWPKLVSQLFETTKEFSSPRVSFYSSDCTIGWKYYDKLIIYLTLPIAYIVISMLILLLISYFYIRERNQKLSEVRNTSEKALYLTKNPEFCIFFNGWAKTTIVIGTFLAWPTVMRQSLSVINCKQIGNIYYLVTDLSVECYTTQHYTYSVIAYIAICLYGIGIPYIGFKLLYNYRFRLYNSENKYSGAAPLSFLFLGYRDTRWYYEFIVMGRKLGLILISVFLKEYSRYQMISANILIQISFFLHVFLRPYDNIINYGILCNKLESLSLLALVVTLSCGMFFGTKSANYNLGNFELALVVILFLANVIVFTYFMINLFYLGYKTLKKRIKHIIEIMIKNNNIKRCCMKCCSEDKLEFILDWSQDSIIDDFGVNLVNDEERFIYKTYLKQKNEKLQLLNNNFDHMNNNKVSLKLEKLRLKIEIIERERCWQNILNNRLYLKLKKIIMLSKSKLDDDDVDKIEKIFTLFIKNGLQYNKNMKELSGKELENLIEVENNNLENNKIFIQNNIELKKFNSETEIII